MKTLAELGHVHRTEPCREYPGRWYANEAAFDTLTEAKERARRVNALTGRVVTVSWCATPGDPRIGEVWFTPFYLHGFYDSNGVYQP